MEMVASVVIMVMVKVVIKAGDDGSSSLVDSHP